MRGIELRDNSRSPQIAAPRSALTMPAADAHLLQPQVFISHNAPHVVITKITSRRAKRQRRGDMTDT